jgi:hypothetical protein
MNTDNMPYNRSHAAFLFSAEMLAEQSGWLYFWTFTWARRLELEEYRRTWNQFSTLLQRHSSPDFKGLRHWERHPRGHGLHVHMLTNERIDVNLVRQLTVRCGLGKVVHVRRGSLKDAKYMSKYMTKSGRIKGVRMWAALGHWEHSLVKNVRDKSKEADFYRKIYHSPDVQALPPNKRWLETRRLVELLWPKWQEMEFDRRCAAQ